MLKEGGDGEEKEGFRLELPWVGGAIRYLGARRTREGLTYGYE